MRDSTSLRYRWGDQCGGSEVRIITYRESGMRTSESPHSSTKLLVSFDSEVRKGGCCKVMRTSESGHESICGFISTAGVGVLGRLCSVLIALFAACSSADAQDARAPVPKGEAAFTEYVAAQLRRAIRGATVKVKGPLTLELGELQANLDRIFVFCNRNTAGCANEIASYVKGV